MKIISLIIRYLLLILTDTKQWNSFHLYKAITFPISQIHFNYLCFINIHSLIQLFHHNVYLKLKIFKSVDLPKFKINKKIGLYPPAECYIDRLNSIVL